MSAAVTPRTFEQLRQGHTFDTTTRTVTEADVASFDSLLAGREIKHLGRWSGAPGSGNSVAPGLLTLAISLVLSRMDPECAVALRGMTDVVFTRPVRAGDTISVEGRVAALAPLDAHTGLVTIVLLTANQHGRTVCRARIQMLWRRDRVADRSAGEAG